MFLSLAPYFRGTSGLVYGLPNIFYSYSNIYLHLFSLHKLNHPTDILIYFHLTYCEYLFKSIYISLFLMAACYLFSSLKVIGHIIYLILQKWIFCFFPFFAISDIQIILQKMFYYAFLCLAVNISPKQFLEVELLVKTCEF